MIVVIKVKKNIVLTGRKEKQIRQILMDTNVVTYIFYTAIHHFFVIVRVTSCLLECNKIHNRSYLSELYLGGCCPLNVQKGKEDALVNWENVETTQHSVA